MLIGKTLWSWSGKDLEKVSDNCTLFKYLSDDQMFFMTTKKIDISNYGKVEHSKIFLLEAIFGSFKITEIYVDKNP